MSTVSINFKITVAGLNAAFNLGAIDLHITHFQLGDGNRIADGSETSLISPKESNTISTVYEVTANQHRIAGLIAASSNSYPISEIGLWSGDPSLSTSVLVFYWSKGTGNIALKSPGVDFNFECDIYFGNAVPSNVTIIADTQFNVLSLIAAHESKPNPHPQYNIADATELIAGKIELATITEAKAGVDTVRAITPAALHAVIVDALNSLPADKYLQGLSSYNAATNVMTLAMSDGSTVNVDMTQLINDAVSSIAVVTASNDAPFANNSSSPASTSWVRGAMSAIAVAAGFSASLTANGYIKFPSWFSGFTLQWCVGASASYDSSQVITFPIAFSSSCLVVVPVTSIYVADSAANSMCQLLSKSVNNCTIYVQGMVAGATTVTPIIIAAGY